MPIAQDVLDLLRAADTQVYQNLDSDPDVSDVQREQLLDFLLLSRPTTGRVTLDRLDDFCYEPANQLSGAPEAAAQSAALGHVKSRAAWQHYIQSAHGPSARGFATRRRRSAAMLVDDLLRLSEDDQKTLLAGQQSIPT